MMVIPACFIQCYTKFQSLELNKKWLTTWTDDEQARLPLQAMKHPEHQTMIRIPEFPYHHSVLCPGPYSPHWTRKYLPFCSPPSPRQAQS